MLCWKGWLRAVGGSGLMKGGTRWVGKGRDAAATSTATAGLLPGEPPCDKHWTVMQQPVGQTAKTVHRFNLTEAGLGK
jgi:hypothetical protein